MVIIPLAPRCPNAIPGKALGLSDYVDVDAFDADADADVDVDVDGPGSLSGTAYLQLPVAAAFVDNTLNSICIFSCPMKRTPHEISAPMLLLRLPRFVWSK